MKEREPLVNVLLSSYCGEAYIAEQIDSVLGQAYPHVELYLRDDGSGDGTVQLVRQRYGDRIHILEGANVGFAASFYRLLREATRGEYWAFCDQDDVWYPQKLSRAVDWMVRQEEGLPLLFHSAYELYTEDLSRKTGEVLPPARPLDFRRAMTDCMYQGFSMVINARLREQLLRCDEKKIGSHDRMAMLIAVAFGRHYFDPVPASKHRRLKSSQSSLDWKSRLRWFAGMFREEPAAGKTLREFERVYAERLPEKEAGILRRFTKEESHMAARLWKAFYPARWRPRLSSEAAVRVLMLLGKI